MVCKRWEMRRCKIGEVGGIGSCGKVSILGCFFG